MDRVKVCQLTPSLNGGGTEERMARVMGAMDRAHFEPSWLGFSTEYTPTLVARAGADVQVEPIERHPESGIEPAVIWTVTNALKKLSPDIIHVHNWSTSLYGIAGAVLAGVPTIVFGIGGRESPERPARRRLRFMRGLAPHVDLFTAVSEGLAREVQEDWWVGPERIRVIHTGIDVDAIDNAPNKAAARAELGIPEDAVVIGAIGLIRAVKRIPDLIEAAGRLAERHPKTHLVVIGPPVGLSQEEIDANVAASGLGDRFHNPGFMPNPSNVIHAFDIFVNCSIFEGSSNAIIEAMAAGLPVVGTAVGGTPELVDHERTGLLVPPMNVPALTDALERLTTAPDLRARYGDLGRQRVIERHRLPQMMERISKLYLELAEEQRRRGLVRRLRSIRGVGASVERYVRSSLSPSA